MPRQALWRFIGDGTCTITATASSTDDYEGTRAQTSVTVIPAVVIPPVNLAPVVISTLGDHRLTTVGPAVTVDVSMAFSDPDADSLTYTATSNDNDVAAVSLSGSTATIRPLAAGWTAVAVTARDPGWPGCDADHPGNGQSGQSGAHYCWDDCRPDSDNRRPGRDTGHVKLLRGPGWRLADLCDSVDRQDGSESKTLRGRADNPACGSWDRRGHGRGSRSQRLDGDAVHTGYRGAGNGRLI